MTASARRTPTPGSVVVGLDDSTGAAHALAWAAEQAAREDRPLTLLHGSGDWAVRSQVLLRADLVDVGELLDQVRAADLAVLEKASRSVQEEHPQLRVEVVLVDTDSRTALVEASRRAHLVVVGSRGHGPVAGVLLGSVSRYVAAHAECPVAVCRPGAPAAGGTRSRVLVGVDWTPGSVLVAEAAFRLASTRGEPLTVMHAQYRIPPALAERRLVAVDDREGVGAMLAEAIGGLREKYPDVPVTYELQRGLADDCLARATSSADLVVVGRPPHDLVSRVLDGVTALAVVEHARGCVVVVPEPAGD